MIKFDPLLDFYEPTANQMVLNNNLAEMLAKSDKILASLKHGLIETGISPFSRFGKAFELIYVSGDLTQYLDELYSGDFVSIDCSNFPLSETSQQELFLFLLCLNKDKVYWHYRTPLINPFLPKYYGGMGFHIYESNCPNPKGKIFKFLDIYNCR